jgi:4'-phosphopantetheinyl transferase
MVGAGQETVTDFPDLRENEVHAWQASLDIEPGRLARIEGILSSDEEARAERLLDRQSRDRYIAGRGLLRTILGNYLGHPPAEIRFTYGEHGKPSLAGEPREGLSFNLSHADDLMLLAVVRGREVGVDLERVQEDLPYRAMAERFLSPRERSELFSLPLELQLPAFYRCWTRKEAYLKGCGSGFSQPPDSLDVSLLHDLPAAILAHRLDPAEAARWKLMDLKVPICFMAALAVTGDAPTVRSFPVTS